MSNDADKTSDPIFISVESSEGFDSEKTPQRFTVWGHKRTVVEELDRWFAADSRYFKVRADDGAVYILRNDTVDGLWELTLFSKREGMG